LAVIGNQRLAESEGKHAEQYNESPTRGSNKGNATFLLDCSWCRDRSLFSGIVILINPKALHTTPLSLLSYVLSERPWAISFVLIATSILAVLPFVLKPKNHFVFIFLLAPQQVLLLAHFTSAFLAIMFGQYPDGYTPDGGSAFIFVDQVWLLMVVVLHTFEYIEAL
jgi:hypothetical protein